MGLCLEIGCVCKIICVVKQTQDSNKQMWDDDTWIGRPREVEAECWIQFLLSDCEILVPMHMAIVLCLTNHVRLCPLQLCSRMSCLGLVVLLKCCIWDHVAKSIE